MSSSGRAVAASPVGDEHDLSHRPPLSMRMCAQERHQGRCVRRGLISPRFSIPSNWPRSETNQSGCFLRSDVIEKKLVDRPPENVFHHHSFTNQKPTRAIDTLR